MRVTVDSDGCIASGQCVWAVPEVFDQSPDESTVVLLDPEPPEEHHAQVREAVVVCPARAIRIEEGS
jgi:ferredoxin